MVHETMFTMNYAERRWKQLVSNASGYEQAWIAEALPKEILDAELKRRTDGTLADVQDYMRLSIRISNEERRRTGVI